ncbi:unnamed protein product [Pleuronectes platessa]|uniref:Uncharacterized protein n=1 Tax=Pleuronectes platessa TaxID=8262 RepID=A0A9N7UFM9_PLEPL|nr:unnamed protein product [Pleuronectes platessa]
MLLWTNAIDPSLRPPLSSGGPRHLLAQPTLLHRPLLDMFWFIPFGADRQVEVKTTTTSPPSSPGSLSCVINNSLFCAVPCEWRHTQSQGHGARGDCWVVANREGHWLNSRLGAEIQP